jgi:hypothetical protein
MASGHMNFSGKNETSKQSLASSRPLQVMSIESEGHTFPFWAMEVLGERRMKRL